MGARIVGNVKWFGSKGEAFGYIDGFTHEDGKAGQVFIHYRHVLEENQDNPKFKVLPKGRKVEFELGEGYPSAAFGSQAINVKLLPE